MIHAVLIFQLVKEAPVLTRNAVQTVVLMEDVELKQNVKIKILV